MEEHQRNVMAGGFVIFVLFVVMCIPIVLGRFEKKNSSQGYQQVEQNTANAH
mgnify:CR=1 FL=1|jgi:hypothetical protein